MTNYQEYTGPPCPHGQPDPWDCVPCSAAMYGGSPWRTCRHGYLPGECPTCDGDAEEAMLMSDKP